MVDDEDAAAKQPQNGTAAKQPRRSTRVAVWTAIFGIPVLLAAEVLDSTEYFSVARDLLGLLGPDRVELTPEQLSQLTEHIDRSTAAGLLALKSEVAGLRTETARVRALLKSHNAAVESADEPVVTASEPAFEPAFEPVAWVQLGEDGSWIARAIFAERAACPEIRVGERAYAMDARHTFAGEQFPVLVCEFLLRTGEAASIEGLTLPAPPAGADSILLVGDTGCRLTHFAWQDCLDQQQWPFRRLLAAVVDDDVDLAIHIGDYHYREKPCAAQRARCDGSPWGDTWEAWREDFFEPAREALRRTPWIMVRGNHEKCERAGAGWHHFLSPTMSDRAPQDRCREFTPPYRLTLVDGPRLVVLDTAYDDRKLHSGDDQDGYARWKEAAGRLIGEDGPLLWLLLHQPLRTLPYKGDPPPTCDADAKTACPLNVVEDALRKRRDGSRSNVSRDVVIAGDTHMFQYVLGADGFVQIVAGMGGTELDSVSKFEGFAAGARQMKREIGGVHYTALARFGFALLTKTNGGWVAEINAIGDNGQITPMVTCVLDGSEDLGPSGCKEAGEAWNAEPTTAAQR